MDLYLLRHATAVNVGEPGAERDALRYLSDEGKIEAEEAGRGIARIARDVRLILSSPYPRAWQTAEFAARAMDREDALEELDALAPGALLGKIAPQINRRNLKGDVMIVGHNPDFEEMISEALVGSADAAVNMKKGSLAVIQFGRGLASGRGVLRALIPCKVLRALGAS